MVGYLTLLCIGAFVFFGSYIWDSIVDRTFRREPSDWLGYAYLTAIVMVLGYGFKYFDEIRSHPYRSSVIAFVIVVLVGWATVILWRKAAKWDKHFHRQRTQSHDR
jgi:hypothetical protein